jgi:hypothetical protein
VSDDIYQKAVDLLFAMMRAAPDDQKEAYMHAASAINGLRDGRWTDPFCVRFNGTRPVIRGSTFVPDAADRTE